MAAVEQQILVKIRAFVEGLASVQALSSSVQNLNRPVGNGLSRTRADVVNLGTASNKSVKDISALYSGVISTAKGFAAGSQSIKQWSADLGNAARAIKPITDQARLLNPAKSIQLGRGSGPLTSEVVTLKPLVESTKAATQLASATAQVAVNTSAAARAAAHLAEEWNKATLAQRKSIEGFAKQLGPSTDKQFQNLIGGGGAEKAAKGVKTFGDEAGKADAKAKSLGNTTNGVSSSLQGFAATVGRLFAISAIFAAVFGALNLIKGAIEGIVDAVKEFLASGLQFNTVIESAKIGIATLVSNTFDLKNTFGEILSPVESFNASLGIAEGLERRLQKAAIDTKFEFAEILTFFNSALVAGAGLNVTVERLASLTRDFALAAGAANINVEKVNTGIKQILTGNTTVRNDLARVLFPGQSTKQINDQLKAFKASGTLVAELEKRLLQFRLSADQVGLSFEALAGNASDAFKVFQALSTSDLFLNVKKILAEVISSIIVIDSETVKLTPTFEKIARIINDISGVIGERLLDVIIQMFDGVERFLEGINASDGRLRDIGDAVFEIGSQLVLWVTDVFEFLTVLRGGEATSRNLLASLQAIALTIASMRDITRAFFGLLQVIATGPALVISLLFEAIADSIDRATLHVTNLTKSITSFRKVIQDAFFGGISKLTDEGEANPLFNRFKAANQRIRGNAGGTIGLGDPIPRPGPGGSGEAGRAAKEAIRARRALLDALAKLQEARAKSELDLAKEANESLRQINQQRYDDQLQSTQDFYNAKFQLDIADIENEKKFLATRKGILQGFLRRDVGNVFGVNEVSTDKLQELTGKARGPVSSLSTKEAQAVKLIVDYKKDILEIDTDIANLNTKADQITKSSTAELAKQQRIQKQMLGDLQSELADSLGQGGTSQLNSLSKRISDEFVGVLTQTNALTPELNALIDQFKTMGNITFDQLESSLEFLGIDATTLSPEVQALISLFERLNSAGKVEGLVSSISKIQENLDANVDRQLFAFDSGESSLEETLAIIKELKNQELPKLNAEFKELTDLLETPNRKFSDEEVQRVNKLGQAIRALKQDLIELDVIKQAGDRAEETAAAKIGAIAIQVRGGTLNDVEAEKAVIAVKRELIAELEKQLALLNAISVKTPATLQTIAEVTNKIGALRNESNSQLLDLKDGIIGSIGGAFESFFDAILSGNESILTSFRRVVASMLGEIAKLIFQAFVLKAIMASLQSVLGGLFGGGAGAAGGAGAIIGGGPDITSGFAEGGFTGVGPTMEPAGIVHRGEYVIPAHRVRQVGVGWLENIRSGAFIPRLRGYAAGGLVGGDSSSGGTMGGRGNTRIVNVLDKGIFSDFMNSAEGEEVILNVIGRNPGVIQRLA